MPKWLLRIGEDGSSGTGGLSPNPKNIISTRKNITFCLPLENLKEFCTDWLLEVELNKFGYAKIMLQKGLGIFFILFT